MKHLSQYLLLLSLAAMLMRCNKPAVQSEYLGVPILEIELAAHNHLDRWFPTIIDSVNGGYWTNFEYDWSRSAEQRKMLVTQARGLWTAAKASEMFPGNPVYRFAADHGYRFLTKKMWYGANRGFRMYYPEQLGPQVQLLYGTAFALFALSEYAKINPAPEVFQWIDKTLNWMEEVAYDSIHHGYFNLLLPKSLATATDSASKAQIRSLGWGEQNWKDQNTTIHMLEAFTALYQVMPDEAVKQRLMELLSIVRDTMVKEEGYLGLYFTNDWQPITYRDSSREFILDNLPYDHISFGHNIETAYLMIDAAKVLYGAPDSKTLEVAKKLVDHTLEHGFDRGYYGLFDKGYYFEGNGKVEILNRQKTWWAQAEACHALALMSQYFPKEKKYKYAFEMMWKYIQQELMDKEHGGWYANGLDENPESKTARKAHEWKGPYHDGRALMLLLGYAKSAD